MKLIGIDYGEKRVGIAFSDDAQKLAFPKETVNNNAQLIRYIAGLSKHSIVNPTLRTDKKYRH